MFRMQLRFVLVFFAALLASTVASAETLTETSPDGQITLTVSDDGGMANYALTYRGEAVIAPSQLGLLFRDHHGFDSKLAITGSARAASDSTWEQPWGERRVMRDNHRELAVTFSASQGPARSMTVRFRLFNDGAGFRYELAEQDGLQGEVNITEELTQFAVGAETQAWWIPSGLFNRYEYLYRNAPAGEVETAHTPITFRKANGVHFSIHEAALVDYSGMSLQQQRPGTLKARLSPRSDGALVRTAAPFHTPWRTIQIAPDAKGLINSGLILNLNEPNKLGDVSWVEPGKYVGIWWAMHINERSWGHDGVHGATTEETKRYIDFAAQHGFNGVLVEGWNVGWDGDWFYNGALFRFTESFPDFDLAELGAYARDKGVRIIGHHETSGNITNYENQMEAAFDLYQSVGVATVKTGYVADAGRIARIDENGIPRYEWHDGQIMVDHHLRVVREAAKRHIAINPHEPVKDTGLRRTYPNWVSREGARGMEYNAWGSPPNPPSHEATLAFTRMLSGPMDFTPGIFDLRHNSRAPVRADIPRHDPANYPQTTLAKQLALYVVLYSPIQMAADLPENYEKHMDAFQFIKDVPTDWEESVALDGAVGEFVAIARKARGSEEWFLGALTDETSREMKLELDFLDPGRSYLAQIYRDGDKADWQTNPYDIAIFEQRVRAGETLTLPLASSGGAAIRFVPVED